MREMAWSLHETTELNVHWLTSSASSSRCLPLDPQTESCQWHCSSAVEHVISLLLSLVIVHLACEIGTVLPGNAYDSAGVPG